MGNHAQKKERAFYHNQMIDYQRWLRANTIGQRRQADSKQRKDRIAGFIGSMLALTMATTK